MKIKHLITGIALSLAMVFGVGAGLINNSGEVKEARAASTSTHVTGTSGEVIYVNGYKTYFNTDDADVAIIFYDVQGHENDGPNFDAVWSERCSYKAYEDEHNDYLPVVIPQKNNQNHTWRYMKVTRYDPKEDPKTAANSGWAGKYNCSAEFELSNLHPNENTYYNLVNFIGWDNQQLTCGTYTHYGIKSRSHMYLDTSALTGWENDGAQLAIYFAASSTFAGDGWSKKYDSNHENLVASFCWKVNGSGQDHLWECIVPQQNGFDVIWNLVIGVRCKDNSQTTEPGWTAFNQTRNLKFDSSSNEHNVVKISTGDNGNWTGGGYNLGDVPTITNSNRAHYYANYFNTCVVCDDDGNTTTNLWSNASAEYLTHLSNDVQYIIYQANEDPDSTGDALEWAMSKYDFSVYKYGVQARPDFIGRGTGQQKSPGWTYGSTVRELYQNSGNTALIIIVISSIGLISLGGLLIFKKKKQY